MTTKQMASYVQQMTVSDMQNHVALIEEVTRTVMRENIHYGKIPGCGDKNALLKPGAEKLALAFNLSTESEVEQTDLGGGHREYETSVILRSRHDGKLVGTGKGTASTMESRYRFRTQNTGAVVPSEYWKMRDPAMLGGPQYTPRKVDGQWFIFESIEHSNPADYYNTCLKMSKKRALVDAVLTATAASDYFLQDIDDDPDLHPAGNNANEAPPPVRTPARSRPAPEKRQTPAAGSDDDVVSFGKNKGKKWSELSDASVRWYAENANMDDVRERASRELSLRAAASGSPSPDDGEPPVISENQIRELRGLLKDKQIESWELLEQIGLSGIADIPADRYADVVKWVNNPSSAPPELS